MVTLFGYTRQARNGFFSICEYPAGCRSAQKGFRLKYSAALRVSFSRSAGARLVGRGLAGLCAIAVSACSFVPRDTPTAESIRGDATVSATYDQQFRYAVVNLSESLLPVLNDSVVSSQSLGRLPPGPSSSRKMGIEPGDIVSVTVFEAAAGGLFGQGDPAAKSGSSATIPNQQVSASGDINVPFAGAVHVAGMTPEGVSSLLASRLAKRALDPQVVVSIVERRSNLVSVLGDVGTPTRFAVDPGGIDILGAIARSGGTRSQGYETLVTLQRGGREYRTMLGAIVHSPSQNVQLAGGDVVFLSHEPQFVTIFGALSEASGGQQNTRRVSFEGDGMTMSEALAKVNGLSDVRADPAKVFLFRYEKASTLRRLGVDTAPFRSEEVPTVYAINLREAEGLFLANHLALQRRDVIVAADATYTDVTKLAVLMNTVVVPPVQAAASMVSAINISSTTSTVSASGVVVK